MGKKRRKKVGKILANLKIPLTDILVERHVRAKEDIFTTKGKIYKNQILPSKNKIDSDRCLSVEYYGKVPLEFIEPLNKFKFKLGSEVLHKIDRNNYTVLSVNFNSATVINPKTGTIVVDLQDLVPANFKLKAIID